ncbi:DAK2 domain-containing protein [Streptomyces sp. NPDC003401]
MDGRITLAGVRMWGWLALDALRREQDYLNAHNAFPTPDRDTGDNLALFWEGFASSLAALPGHMSARAAVRQAVVGNTGVVGNSAYIMRAWLLGFAGSLTDPHGPTTPTTPMTRTAPALSHALRAGAEAAVQAVSRPAAGTMLTVFSTTAELSRAPGGFTPTALGGPMRHLLAGSPAPGPDGTPVDAGAYGAQLVLHALAAALAPAPACPHVARPHHEAPSSPTGVPRQPPEYELQLTLRTPDSTLPALRSALDDHPALSSVVVVSEPGSPQVHSVHLHSPTPELPPDALPSRVEVLRSSSSPVAPSWIPGQRREREPHCAALVVTGSPEAPYLPAETDRCTGGELPDAIRSAAASSTCLLVIDCTEGNPQASATTVTAARRRHPSLPLPLLRGPADSRTAEALRALRPAAGLLENVRAVAERLRCDR